MPTAIVIGHTFEHPGSYSPILNVSEWYYWQEFRDTYCKDLDVDFFEHNYMIRSYNERQRDMGVKTSGYDLVLELHFNGAESNQANGVEALHYFSNENTKDLSEYFCELVSNTFDIKNRGAKGLYSPSQRGYGFVNHMRGDAILLEPFFGSNYNDCDNFVKHIFVDILREIC